MRKGSIWPVSNMEFRGDAIYAITLPDYIEEGLFDEEVLAWNERIEPDRSKPQLVIPCTHLQLVDFFARFGRADLINNLSQGTFGGAVLLVHHTGKDGTKGLRGHSSLYAALDAAIEVSRSDASREWSVAKSKDDADDGRHAFVLRVLELGDDEHGEPVTSCTVEPDDRVAPVRQGERQRRKPPTGQNAKLAIRVLAQILRDSRNFAMGGAPAGRPCVQIEDARIAVMEALPVEPKRKRERADYALTSLLASGDYEAREGWIWCA